MLGHKLNAVSFWQAYIGGVLQSIQSNKSFILVILLEIVYYMQFLLLHL